MAFPLVAWLLLGGVALAAASRPPKTAGAGRGMAGRGTAGPLPVPPPSPPSVELAMMVHALIRLGPLDTPDTLRELGRLAEWDSAERRWLVMAIARDAIALGINGSPPSRPPTLALELWDHTMRDLTYATIHWYLGAFGDDWLGAAEGAALFAAKMVAHPHPDARWGELSIDEIYAMNKTPTRADRALAYRERFLAVFRSFPELGSLSADYNTWPPTVRDRIGDRASLLAHALVPALQEVARDKFVLWPGSSAMYQVGAKTLDDARAVALAIGLH